jgi:hypothetical protein
MPHHHLEGLNNQWLLVRETPSSQIYRCTTPGGLGYAVDIHFTPPTILTVSLVFLDTKGKFTDGVTHDIFEDLEKIALRRGDYAVIDYTLSFADKISDGNYAISDEWRKVASPHLRKASG